jgi:isoquinoline 1-oxidoreductase subunit beta
LKVTWDNADLEKSLHTDEYFKRCYEASKKEEIVYEQSGSFETKFASAEKKLEATFETPFLAHVPVEPENATVHVRENGEVEV